jgi:3-methylcrotonyl-CoA carboxylase beta subunit
MTAGHPPHGERMREALAALRTLEVRVRAGGGAARIERQHIAGKLTARERLAHLLDPHTRFLEIGLLAAHDRYEGQAPAAGIVTAVGHIAARPVVVVANDATVKAGAWWPETIQKILRAQEIAMRNRLPIVYLVDSAGVNLPLQDEIFPGQRGAGRIFYYNSLMRRRLKIPQAAAVMGPCIAGGAYLPALSDVIFMVDKTSFMGLGGANLVKGATGQTVDAEALGGARMHTSVSGVAHHLAANDEECLKMIRRWVEDAAAPLPGRAHGKKPAKSADGLLDVLPDDHRLPYDVADIVDRVFDDDGREEFQPEYAPELLCARLRLDGRAVGVMANRRGFLKSHGAPRIGGILYTESARKAAYFVEMCNREALPLVYLQDVAGFMVGVEQETDGIIRAGAEMVEAMACADVPRIVVTISHASGAGYYAMAGQGFDPTFTFAWPTARIGVMEGESAVMAVHGQDIERYEREQKKMPKELDDKIARTRADYERWLDARYAAARGHVDAVIDPTDTRDVLAFALDAACAAGPRHRWTPEAL